MKCFCRTSISGDQRVGLNPDIVNVNGGAIAFRPSSRMHRSEVTIQIIHELEGEINVTVWLQLVLVVDKG